MTPKLNKNLADRDKLMSLWQVYTQVNPQRCTFRAF